MMKNRIKFLFLLLLLMPVSLCASPGPEILNIRQYPDSAGLFEKFEVALQLKCEFVNPFDPDDIDIEAVFTSPSGRVRTIPGFYYLSGSTLWKIRFSPDEPGIWRYKVMVRDKNGTATREGLSFVSFDSGRKGPLQVSENKRYLKYGDGSDFYGVGLWYNDGYEGYGSGRIEGEELDRLKSLGINFISTYITPLETWGSGIGRYDQNICGRLDQLLEMCEEREMVLSLNLWFHSYLSETVWGGGNVRWYMNPYQQVTSARDFYRSVEAWKYQEKLYRYIIARYSYSRSLAIWFIVDEINGTDGWVSGDSLAASAWGKKVHDYLKANDPYNHPTTGTRSGGIQEYWTEGYTNLDIAAREIYEGQGYEINKTGTLDSASVNPLTSSYSNYAREIRRLWNGFDKPVIIGETGWDHTFFEPSMPGYLAMYHNALWVSLTTGTAMTPFWWAHSRLLDDNILTSQITGIRKFTDQIPFGKLADVMPAEAKSSKGDAFAIKSDRAVFGWAVNSASDVADSEITLSGLKNGKYRLRIFHTWRGEFIDDQMIICSGGKVIFGVPYMRNTGSHARYIGQDVAFILEPLQ
jgi:hypothetical protein